jgi:hypothetical protein
MNILRKKRSQQKAALLPTHIAGTNIESEPSPSAYRPDIRKNTQISDATATLSDFSAAFLASLSFGPSGLVLL